MTSVVTGFVSRLLSRRRRSIDALPNPISRDDFDRALFELEALDSVVELEGSYDLNEILVRSPESNSEFLEDVCYWFDLRIEGFSIQTGSTQSQHLVETVLSNRGQHPPSPAHEIQRVKLRRESREALRESPSTCPSCRETLTLPTFFHPTTDGGRNTVEFGYECSFCTTKIIVDLGDVIGPAPDEWDGPDHVAQHVSDIVSRNSIETINSYLGFTVLNGTTEARSLP